MDERVSVVIPTYKRKASSVLKAVESVQKQTYQNIEIIVVDDNGETQLSHEIFFALKSFEDVKYIAHKENKGACWARNTGIKNSTGEYIAFLDDDDTWKEEKIEKQMNMFNSNTIGLVYCGVNYFFEREGVFEYKKAIKSNNPCRDLLIYNYIGTTSCGIVRKSAVVDVGMFDTNLRSGQDLDLWYRIAQKYDLEYVEECLVDYTVYSQNTITSNYNNRLKSNIYLKSKYADVIVKDKELVTVYNLKIAKAYFKLRNYFAAIKFILTCFCNNEISIRHMVKYIK